MAIGTNHAAGNGLASRRRYPRDEDFGSGQRYSSRIPRAGFGIPCVAPVAARPECRFVHVGSTEKERETEKRERESAFGRFASARRATINRLLAPPCPRLRVLWFARERLCAPPSVASNHKFVGSRRWQLDLRTGQDFRVASAQDRRGHQRGQK